MENKTSFVAVMATVRENLTAPIRVLKIVGGPFPNDKIGEIIEEQPAGETYYVISAIEINK